MTSETEIVKKLVDALDYVYERTCISKDGEWTFKIPYEPENVIEALTEAQAYLEQQGKCGEV